MATAPQDLLRQRIETAGIPFKEIKVYGSQIVVTAWSEGAAKRWASLIATFAKVRRVLQAVDYDKHNTNTCLKPSCHGVWRVFAAI